MLCKVRFLNINTVKKENISILKQIIWKRVKNAIKILVDQVVLDEFLIKTIFYMFDVISFFS